MTSLKRKFNEYLDSDEEEPAFGKQILPVADLPDDFDGEPMDGMQYLFLVRRDARALPHVTRVENPYEMPEAPPPAPRITGEHPAIPTAEWRSLFVRRFQSFRQNINQPTIHVHIPPDRCRKLMPDTVERDLWWKFLAGEPESVWNPPKVQKQKKKRKGSQGMRAWDDPGVDNAPTEEVWHIDEEGQVALKYAESVDDCVQIKSAEPTANVGADSVEQVRQEVLRAREPSMTLLKEIDHKMALHLLMYFTHWMNLYLQNTALPTYRLTEAHARWIFVLLSRVDDYLTADEMHLLRNLARGCLGTLKENVRQRLLASSGPTQDNMTIQISERSCWMIISLVVGIWAQRDLWMDAEDAISDVETRKTAE
ncbi:hypothetical protein AX16_001013 [Volvariella volvacea WC 439]|nr:hypothetical protein AX16_001013 [Volvariella volvacea WC 439]